MRRYYGKKAIVEIPKKEPLDSTIKIEPSTTPPRHPVCYGVLTNPILQVKMETTPDLPPVTRKKRRLLIDSMRSIPNAEFKLQLKDTSDIVGKVDVAPATKKAMYHLTFSSVGKYFALPGRKILSGRLSNIFFSHLTVKTQPLPAQNEELKPLNPELRTPNNTNMDSFTTAMPSKSEDFPPMPVEFSESLAKRTASSFDQFVEGFSNIGNKLKPLENGTMTQQSFVEIPSDAVVLDYEDSSPISSPKEIITADPLETDEPEYSIVQKVNEELQDVENEIFYVNGNNQSDGSAVQSKIEMLLAAAQKNENSTIGVSQLQLTGDCTELQIQCATEDRHSDSKQILFCTAQTDADGSFIFVDGNGKRYTVSTHSSLLTLWPEAAEAVD